jgi:hypothetical protein
MTLETFAAVTTSVWTPMHARDKRASRARQEVAASALCERGSGAGSAQALLTC